MSDIKGNLNIIYRPQTFTQCYGNIEAIELVKNDLMAGEVKQSYLFSGDTGCGKTTLARLFAKALNCINSPGICSACPSCLRIQSGRDFAVKEIDGATYRGIDNVAEIQNECFLAAGSLYGKHRIFLW